MAQRDYVTIYCLDLGRSIVRTDFRELELARLEEVAQSYLQDFAAVEIWSGQVRKIELRGEVVSHY